MEFSSNEVSRKFYRTVTFANLPYRVERKTPVHVLEISRESGKCLVTFQDLDTGEILTFPVKTEVEYSTKKGEAMELLYWVPKTGYYHTKTGQFVFVKRRVAKAFNVGLHSEAYSLAGLLKPCNSNDIDIRTPPVDILQFQGTIYYFGEKIGIVENNRMYINDPMYVKFLPDDLRSLWKKS